MAACIAVVTAGMEGVAGSKYIQRRQKEQELRVAARQGWVRDDSQVSGLIGKEVSLSVGREGQIQREIQGYFPLCCEMSRKQSRA